MQSALLWYKTFRDCLSGLGFTLNPYDPCVANKVIKGKQCTICWYVDDTTISHEYPNVVDYVVSKLEYEFGKMMVTRGKKHTFVGIDIDFNEDGTVTLSMDEYINECINLYRESIKDKAAIPAKGDLFDKDNEKEGVELPMNEANKFHHTTAKLL